MHKLTTAEVMYLLEGGDRGNQPRTWQEVADYLGYSIGYVQRIGKNNINNPIPQVWVDPREVIPDLKHALNDEDVERWNEHPHCLCGCGVTTLQERGLQSRIPRGGLPSLQGQPREADALGLPGHGRLQSRPTSVRPARDDPT